MGVVKKRKLAGGNARPPQKRSKIDSAPAPAKDTKPSGFRTVDLDSLKWKEDPDGFMGLEVLSGVNVVRDGDKVRFTVADTAVVEQDEKDESSSPFDGDEFEGFDDDPEPANQEESSALEDNKEETAEEVPQKRQKSGKVKKQALGLAVDTELGDTSFNVLDGMDQTSEDADMSAWTQLDLSPPILSAIARLKFSQPTTIQTAAIPPILQGHDVIGKASTGSGKTLAFAIPMVERWLEARESDTDNEEPKSQTRPFALVLSPTRELAHQIVGHIKDLCEGLPVSPFVCSVTGGLSVQKQQRQLSKADIIVATPGRFWEVIGSDLALIQAFKEIKFLVVDEADRLLSEGHFKELEEILNALDRAELGDEEEDFEDSEDEEKDEKDEDGDVSGRQTLVFSATFNKHLQQKLAGRSKFNLMDEHQSLEYLLKKLNFREEKPKFIDVNPLSQMADRLREGLVECGAMEKDLYLYALLLMNPVKRTLVFTNSISSVRRLTPFLQTLRINALPLHSQMIQKARLRSLERFTASKSLEPSILVATDVAARGLDIPNVDQVVHYHVPRAADTYVHRSGRTARAQSSGVSVLLCAPDEVTPTRRLVAKVHIKKASEKQYVIQTVDIDRRIAGRLRPRVDLAKRIADAQIAKDKGGKEDSWLKSAAEELGVEYDSEELDEARRWGGRGAGRKQKQDEARGLSKAEMGAMKAQLRELLDKKINTGISERYIAGGGVDINALLNGAGSDVFLGQVDGLGLTGP